MIKQYAYSPVICKSSLSFPEGLGKTICGRFPNVKKLSSIIEAECIGIFAMRNKVLFGGMILSLKPISLYEGE